MVVLSVIGNDDLLREILLHLPPMHVLQLRLVCRRWNNLISDPAFRRQHSRVFSFSLNTSNSILLQSFVSTKGKFLVLLKGDDNDNYDDLFPPSRSFSFNFDYLMPDPIPIDCNFHVLDGSSGLLLVSLVGTGGAVLQYFVCNPLTKASIQLPSLPPGFRDILQMRITFDPFKSIHYKVVALSGISKKDGAGAYEYSDYEIYVYSSQTSTWNITQRYSEWSKLPKITTSSELDSIASWIPSRRELDGFCFDLESGNFKSSPLRPHNSSIGGPHPYRVFHKKSSGYLYRVEVSADENQDQYNYNVWEMKGIQDCHCSWTLKFSFQLGGRIKIYYIHRKSDEELQFFVTFSLKDENNRKIKGLEFVDLLELDAGIPTNRWNIIKYRPTLFPFV